MKKLYRIFTSVLVLCVGCALFSNRNETPEYSNTDETSEYSYLQPIRPTGEPVTAETPLNKGDTIEAEWDGRWWIGKIIALQPDGQVKIHYVGWESRWDEIVPRSRLRIKSEYSNTDKTSKYSYIQSIEPSGKPVTAETRLNKGDTVEAEWDGRWWIGKIIALQPDGQVKIHYVGWESRWDEIVPRSRLRIKSETPDKSDNSLLIE